MRDIKVQVTAEHIAESELDSDNRCRSCPVALALSDTFGEPMTTNGFSAIPSRGDADADSNGSTLAWFTLPLSVQEWIHRSDTRLPVQPFSFTFEAPEGEWPCHAYTSR